MIAPRILSCAFLTAVLALAQPQTQTNSLGMEFLLVEAGSFTMGMFQPRCPAVGAGDNVTEAQYQECMKLAAAATRAGFKAVIAKPFYVGKYEVTQDQYQKVMGKNPSYHTQSVVASATDKYPVDSVTWADTQAFLKKLNAMEKGKAYRLPTEVEWEYAARAGTEGETQGGKIQDLAWFMSNAGYVTHPVGQKQPNPWGLYDTLGNVWEWVQDYYDNDILPKGPKGPAKGTTHVLRGGGFQAHAKNIRVVVHAGGPGSVISTGFRVVMEAQ
jgi:formylglycine-generating enzyme required for sulfatase activity